MKIKITLSIGLVGCRRETEIELPDDLSEEDIEAEAKEAMFEMLDWNYERVDGEGQ